MGVCAGIVLRVGKDDEGQVCGCEVGGWLVCIMYLHLWGENPSHSHPIMALMYPCYACVRGLRAGGGGALLCDDPD